MPGYLKPGAAINVIIIKGGVNMERAFRVDWRQGEKQSLPAGADRIYFGHETCFHHLPSSGDVPRLAAMIKEKETKATFVTPFLTDNELPVVCRLIGLMLDELAELEVVCSDWGLLHYIYKHKHGTPVIGRLLAGQATDPRVMRILASQPSSGPRRVRHLDGTRCTLKKKPPSPALTRHYRSCRLDRPRIIDFLKARGVQRCEIANTGQGIELAAVPGWRYSLWLPDVPVTVMRQCPGAREDFNIRPACPGKNCGRESIPWHFPSFPREIFRYCSGLYYSQPGLPANLDSLPVDRIVFS